MTKIAGWAVAAAITLVGLVALPAGSNAASFFLSVVLPTLAPWLAAAALGIAGLALWRNKKALALLAAIAQGDRLRAHAHRASPFSGKVRGNRQTVAVNIHTVLLEGGGEQVGIAHKTCHKA